MSKSKSFRTAAVVLLTALLCSCTNEQEARRVLEMDGVTDVQVTGYSWFACGKGDFYHTGFTGKRNGKTIDGTVCSGLLFKASTVRY